MSAEPLWAIERVKAMQSSAETNAALHGVKLLKGHGWPNEIMHDAQDAVALREVLEQHAALIATVHLLGGVLLCVKRTGNTVSFMNYITDVIAQGNAVLLKAEGE